jgi:hypothetical protein
MIHGIAQRGAAEHSELIPLRQIFYFDDGAAHDLSA